MADNILKIENRRITVEVLCLSLDDGFAKAMVSMRKKLMEEKQELFLKIEILGVKILEKKEIYPQGLLSKITLKSKIEMSLSLEFEVEVRYINFTEVT